MIDKRELARALAYEYLGDEEQYLQDILEDPEHVGLMYTTYEDDAGYEHEMQVEVDLVNLHTYVYRDAELAYTEYFTEEDYEDITGAYGSWYDGWYSYFVDKLTC